MFFKTSMHPLTSYVCWLRFLALMWQRRKKQR